MNRIKPGILNITSRLGIIKILFILPIILGGQLLYSQQISDKPALSDEKNFREALFVRTDRDIYIAGEQVLLKVYKLGGPERIPTNVSKVVYIELLDKNNFPLRQVKIWAENSSGSSFFTIPDNISSGNYIIRAYTSWMQNFPVDQFAYSVISVINPFESIDHLKLPSKGMSDDSLRRRSDNVNSIITAADQQAVSYSDNGKIKFTVSPDHQQYPVRGKVKIRISATDADGRPVETDLSVAVSRAALVTSVEASGFHNTGDKKASFGRSGQKDYLPELEGHIVRGHIRLKTTDEPVRNIDVSLSFVGKTARCQFSKTDEKGEFYFVVDETGLNEMVIQPLSPDITGYYIELNQPFSSIFSDIKRPDFFLDSSKISEINKAVIATQVSNIYSPPGEERTLDKKPVVPDFYGKPENSIKMSDYIELTSVREVVKEIIPNVYTLRQNGNYDFKLINKFRGQPFENKPLVLVDGVPVYDFEKVLNISSKDIERVDVINTRYFFSDNVFDGILSFITKKGNLGAMEFDNTIFRQVYDGCQEAGDFISPDYSTRTSRESHIPDFRNTLFWKPDGHTGKDGNTDIEFFTSDESTIYKIVVEGITPDGKTGYASVTFHVK